jgi:acetylornithine/N-succinyldiaminopimelate aminotransferase
MPNIHDPPTSTDLATSEHAALMLHDQRPRDALVRGAGAWVWDARGRQYLDFVQGWAVNTFGHAPALVRRALARQARTLVNVSPAFHNPPQTALAGALTRHAGLAQAFFCSTGAEANEGALKLARKWGRAHKGGAHVVITTEGSFHGRTLATMAASGKPGWDDLFPPRMPGFVKVPFGDAALLAAAIRRVGAGEVAAIFVEPIQGEGGVVVPPDGYLRELRAIADEANALLILDEVQTGMGRTGTLFAFEHEGTRPDVLTLGKGLGAGVPLAALLASARASCFAPGEQGGTFCGTPLMTAVGLAVAQAVAAPAFLSRVRRRASELVAGLRALAARHGGQVRGRGLLQAWVLATADAPAIVRRARDAGLLINSPRPDVLRFMPALNVTRGEIHAMLERLEAVMTRPVV